MYEDVLRGLLRLYSEKDTDYVRSELIEMQEILESDRLMVEALEEVIRIKDTLEG